MIEALIKYLGQHKNIAILGFGREGKSAFQFLQKHLPGTKICIADAHKETFQYLDTNPLIRIQSGENYLNGIENYDLIIKSPGVQLDKDHNKLFGSKLSSLTALFMQFFHKQCIGITGTKGKSTTSSLIHHILKDAGRDSILAGNIGKPVFDCLEQIHKNSVVVYELSAHQLELCRYSPHIAILLNLFEEHLDYFGSTKAYHNAKCNIFRFQDARDHLLLPEELKNIKNVPALQHIINTNANAALAFTSDDLKLPGKHNFLNALFAAKAASLLQIDAKIITRSIKGFRGLAHRLEYLGTYKGIIFYNDSISTVPEASIAALQALPETHSLILGGFDRGINYQALADFLPKSRVKKIYCMGEAGKRMMQLFQGKVSDSISLQWLESLEEIVKDVFQESPGSALCLLSPAAASYDRYKNFEERGKDFQSLILKYSNNETV